MVGARERLEQARAAHAARGAVGRSSRAPGEAPNAAPTARLDQRPNCPVSPVSPAVEPGLARDIGSAAPPGGHVAPAKPSSAWSLRAGLAAEDDAFESGEAEDEAIAQAEASVAQLRPTTSWAMASGAGPASARRGSTRGEAAEDELEDLPPDPAWEDDRLPAGSRFTHEQWQQAREGERFVVFEIHNGGGQEVLLQVPRAPEPTVRRRQIRGKWVEESIPADPAVLDKALDPVSTMVLDGCLLLGPGSVATHPRAIAQKVRLATGDADLGVWEYRLIRPMSHWQTCPWMFGAGTAKLAYGRAAVESTAREAVDGDSARPRPRG